MRTFLTSPITILLAIAGSNHLVNGFSLEPKASTAARSNLFRRHGEESKSFRQAYPVSPRASPSLTALNLSGGSKGDISSPKPSLSRELIAEFIGTFMIVQIGCGTVCAAVFKGAQVGLWQIAVVWSIAVTLAISCTAAISGAHLNPAITFAFATVRDFEWKKVIPFIIAQVLGAVAAGGVNFALFRDSIAGFEKLNGIVRGAADSVQSASAFGEYWSVSNWGTAFFAEAHGTAILAFVIFALTNADNETTSKHPFLVPPLIGATVAALISVIAPLTQAGFNPARDFGPRIIALLAGWGNVAMQGWWLYVAAPFVGAPIGAWVADKVLYPKN
eukprot:scaffold1307_cov260-Chaetoceros_neogracile.AAC.2